MCLSLDQMPMPLTAQAIEFASGFRCFNTPDADKKGRYKILICLTAPLRVTARIIYSIAVSLICTPLGVVYHVTAAVVYKASSFLPATAAIQARRSTQAWEHFKAAAFDVAGFIQAYKFFVEPDQTVHPLLSENPVHIEFPRKEKSEAEQDANDEVVQEAGKLLDEVTRKDMLSPNWAFHQYEMGVKRQFQFNHLYYSRSFIRNTTGHHVALNSEANLRVLHALSLHNQNFCHKISERLITVDLLKELDAKDIDRTPIKYSFPSKPIAAVALTITGVALSVLANYALLAFTGVIHTFLLALPFAILAMGLEFSRRQFINHYGEAEMMHAIGKGGDQAEFWYRKAISRGYAPAMRNYANFLFGERRINDGVELLHAAVANGSKEAMEDLRNRLAYPPRPLPDPAAPILAVGA